MVNNRCRKDTSAVGSARSRRCRSPAGCGRRRKALGVIPGARRDAVPSGARGEPGRFDRNLGRQLVDLAEHSLHLSSSAAKRAKVVLADAPKPPDRRMSHPRRTAGRSRPRVRRQPEHPFVGVANRLRTELDRHPRYDLLGEDPSADALVGLQHQRRQAGIEHLPGGDHPRQPAPTMMTSARGSWMAMVASKGYPVLDTVHFRAARVAPCQKS